MASQGKGGLTTPKRQNGPQLKWHNTLPEDFSGKPLSRRKESGSTAGHKRQNSFHELQAAQTPTKKGIIEPFYQNEFASAMPVSISPGSIPSPTKRQKATTVNGTLKTPVKIRTGGALGSVKSTSSGMATPPPTTATTGRRRGRPPKNRAPPAENILPPAQAPTSVLAKAMNSTPSSRTLLAEQPIQQPKFKTNPPQLDSTRPSTSAAELSKNIFWEGNADLSAAIGTSTTSGFDWSSVSATSSDVADMLDTLTCHTSSTDNISSDYDPNDRMHFSFMGEEDSLDSFALSVDPNLIFASSKGELASPPQGAETRKSPRYKMPFLDMPYQHQVLYAQREKEALKEKKRLEKERKLAARKAGLDVPFEPSTSRAGSVRSRSQASSPVKGGSVFSDDAQGPGKKLKRKPIVQLTISPSGRAKTEIRHESDTEPEEAFADAEPESSNQWQDYLDSDSSLDEDTPRGLGPGGRDYSTIRASRMRMHDGSPRKPRNKYSSMPTLRTPSKRATGATIMSIFPDTSPQLPAPLKPSPQYVRPTSKGRSRRISCSSFNSQFTASTGVFTTLSDLRDESEAETVHGEDDFDGNLFFGSEDLNGEGNALHALKELMAGRNSRPKSSASSIATSSASQSVSSIFPGGPALHSDLPADFLSNSSPMLARFFETPRARRPRTEIDYAESSPGMPTPSSPTPMPRRQFKRPSLGEDDGQTRCVCNNTRGGGTTMVQW